MGLYEDQTSPIQDYVTLPYINTSVGTNSTESGAKYCPKNTEGRKEKRGRGGDEHHTRAFNNFFAKSVPVKVVTYHKMIKYFP